MSAKQLMKEPDQLRNWVRRPLRTYRIWKLRRWLRSELRKSLFAEMDRQMIHGEGRELRGINPSLEEWDEAQGLNFSHTWLNPNPAIDYPPVVQEIVKCKHCGEEIVWVVSSVDDFWTHKARRVGYCDSTANWVTAKTWAWPEGVDEPKPLNLTMTVIHTEPHFSGFEGVCGCQCAECVKGTKCICAPCPCHTW